MLGARESIKKAVLSTQGSVKRVTRIAVKVGTGYGPAQPKTFLEEVCANDHPPSDRVFSSAVSTEKEHSSHPLRYWDIARGTGPAESTFLGPVTTDEMRRMKTQTAVHLMWLLILVLQFAWITKGLFLDFIWMLTVENSRSSTFKLQFNMLLRLIDQYKQLLVKKDVSIWCIFQWLEKRVFNHSLFNQMFCLYLDCID